MFDFDALKVFTVVVEEGGFNAAAHALFKSQPSVTNMVKKLEEQLNLVLFDRSHYRSILTPEGEKFYKRAKILVNQWKDTAEFAKMLQSREESDITIAIDVFYPLEKLKDVFSQWFLKYPHTHFHFLSESLGGACERLVEGEADIAITENLMMKHAIEVIPLHYESLIAVASPAFIMHYEEKLSHLSTLNKCMQVILKDSSKNNFSFGVLEDCPHWTVGDIATKKEIILAGLGWGRLPLHVIHEDLKEGRLQELSGNHFDLRKLLLSAIRLQKTERGKIAEELWKDLKNHSVK
jgi:DNA-binding transcriptional LysR family regulator